MIRAPRTFRTWLVAFALCALAAEARADTLVLYQRPDLRPGLCVALRIQLTGLADVRCQPDLPGSPPERIAAASRSLDGDVRLAVLLEADERYARMLIVGDAPDRALLAIEPVEARPEPDVDRALALKVRETFELSRSLPRVVPGIAPRRSANVLLELGAALSTGSHSRGLGVAALGVRGDRESLFAELVLLGRLASSLDQARVREQEWALGLGARLGLRRARFSFGPALEVSVVRASARGVSGDGRVGDAELGLARFDLALDLRIALLRTLWLRFAPALELDPQAQRFTVESEVLSLGHVRLLLPVSVVVEIGS